MSLKILLTGPRMLRDLDTLRPRFDELGWELVVADVVQRLTEDELIPLVGDIDGTICGGDLWTARVMDAAPKLRAICKWGTGIDAIDVEAARERGIAVRNVPDAFSVPVAETVLGYMLSFTRRQPWLTNALRRGEWARIDGTTLAESTVGIVGVGAIGSTVARRAAVFGAELIGCDPKPVPLQLVDETRIRMTDLETVLRESDFVSVNCDLNPTSRQLFSEREFAMMKPTGVFINTSRGPVVDQPALIRALSAGVIGGAALDVFEEEPLGDSPLCHMDNVLLSPHLANSSDRSCKRVHDQTIRNIRELLTESNRRLEGVAT